jgi:hypothetical protein
MINIPENYICFVSNDDTILLTGYLTLQTKTHSINKHKSHLSH